MTKVHDRVATVTLPAADQILITRELAAPPPLVWKAWTTPELVARWWHARRGTMTVCEIDLRVGGAWRYAIVADGGAEIAFHGEYREIVPHERLVSTEIFEGFPDAVAVDTLTLTALAGGHTRLEVLVQHATQAHRDAHIASGMEDGLQDALSLLDRVAAAA